MEIEAAHDNQGHCQRYMQGCCQAIIVIGAEAEDVSGGGGQKSEKDRSSEDRTACIDKGLRALFHSSSHEPFHERGSASSRPCVPHRQAAGQTHVQSSLSPILTIRESIYDY